MRALGFKRKKLRVRITSLDDDDKGTDLRWCYARGVERQ
jgi:hypothetical protein